MDWPVAELPQKIGSDQVHVWSWDLAIIGPDSPAHAALLDPQELERMNRFHFEGDRSRFLLSHANMRRILGGYLGEPPERISLLSNRFGKPELSAAEAAGRMAPPPLRFNLSHSRTVALLAVSLDVEVGVDVEDIRPIEPEIAKSFFSAMEISALAQLEGDSWLQGFYHCWTRKEAILKAEGVGLNLPLADFDVSLTPGGPPELLGSRPPAKLRHPWKLHDLSPAAGTIGALAMSRSQAAVACYRLGENVQGTQKNL
ncbi:MAG TPA: 4'-phosphopantetheinyl transferase superfamily protein [Acidobacteriaceae bacterium]|nr:4'-phosphopantetheinyl transferase superfamily protein [Acidobacteriaceae bacterium]